jgi:xanthine/uracil permease
LPPGQIKKLVQRAAGSFPIVLGANAVLFGAIGLTTWLGTGLQRSRVLLLFLIAVCLAIAAFAKARSRRERIFSTFLAALLCSGLAAALFLNR